MFDTTTVFAQVMVHGPSHSAIAGTAAVMFIFIARVTHLDLGMLASKPTRQQTDGPPTRQGSGNLQLT
jgi:hypothetical protein